MAFPAWLLQYKWIITYIMSVDVAAYAMDPSRSTQLAYVDQEFFIFVYRLGASGVNVHVVLQLILRCLARVMELEQRNLCG